MKLSRLVALLLIVVFALISCKQDPAVEQITKTPTIRGSVSIPSGSGLSGSDFFVRVMEGENAVYTGKVNSDGSFSVQGLKEGTLYSILLTTDEPGDIAGSSRDISRDSSTSGYGGWLSNVTASMDSQAGVGSIKVKPLGTIRGVVHKDGASDGYDTTVYIPGTSFLAMTDGEGNFNIFNVPQATYTLRFISNGYMAKMLSDVVLYSDSDTENPVATIEKQILIKNSGSIEGIAIRDGESDNSGIIIRLESGDSATNYTASTAVNGYFRIDDVAPGKYKALASYAGYLSRSSNDVTITASNLTTITDTIELFQNAGTIKGSVSLFGSTIKGGINISITGIDSSRSYTALTSDDGSFSRNVSAGSYNVTAYYPGYISRSSVATVSQGTSIQIDFSSLSSMYGSISGRVILDGSLDSSGVVVTATDSTDNTRRFSSVTDSQGTYLITGITSDGSFIIECTKDGYIRNSSTSVNVSLGAVSEVNDLTMRSITSKVSGQAALEGSDDHSGISVLLKTSDDSVQYDATTDQQGNWVMARVNPGEYNLLVSKSGYVSKTLDSIVVESSTEKAIDSVSLSVGVRSITGTVIAELKTNHSGSLITATNLSDQTKVYSAISNSDGVFTLAGMVPGEYSIVISHTGYRSITLPTVNVIEGATKTLEAQNLEINRGTISGVATLEGRTSSSGIQVELLQGLTVVATDSTDESGEYSFYVPQGNYSGVRLSKSDFRMETVSSSIALFADNYIAIDNTELSATANSVFGTADVLTIDDESGITISFDGHSEISAFITSSDGSFRFDSIPLGNYTMRLKRDNCADITIPVSVVPADGINLGTIAITPNTATITGKVNLEHGSSLAGVLVSVDMGTETATGYTDAGGRYEIGGISVADTYTVTYSKNGWQSNSQQISPKLERLEVREVDEITLVDTTSPVLNSVVINNGANTASDRNVVLYFTAVENGSGISKVLISYDNTFDETTPRYTYMPSMNWELPSGNGEKVIYLKVMDASGNISNTVSASVVLTDQKKVVSGVLTGGDLHWTEEMSPYLVAGNILVEDDKTLTIDAGVDVQFAGSYYIQVEGILSAVGTNEKRISFYGIDEGEDAWQGIKGVYNKASSIKYSDISGIDGGLQGYLSISDSRISASSSGYALGGTTALTGSVTNSTASGRINVSSSVILSSEITVLGNNGWWDDENSIIASQVIDSSFDGNELYIKDTTLANDKLSSLTLNLNNISAVNSTISNSTVTVNGGMIYKSELDDCTFSSFSYGTIRDSNIIDCGKLTTATQKSDIEQISLRNNYWGINNTAELNANGVNSNLSFIGDYYDDFNVTKADLSGYKTTAIADAGYAAIEPIAAQYAIGDAGPAGGIVFYDKGCYSDGWRYLEAAPSDIGGNREYIFGYYKKSDDGNILRSGTADGIGFGKLNTEILVGDMGDAAYSSMDGSTKTEDYASRLCDTYTYGGYSDWFLPSKDELNLMYVNLHKAGLGGFANDYAPFWSSSEYYNYNNCTDYAWEQNFSNGDQQNRPRHDDCRVRPVRAF